LNLGGDIQSVEERDLRGVKTSWAWWDDDFEGSKGSDLSRGGDLVTFDDGLKVTDGGIREDESDFTLAALEQLFDLWDLSVVLLSEFEILITLFRSLESDVDGLLDDGVLSADHITELLLSESQSSLLNLTGGDVFKLDNEALLELGEVLVQSVHNTALLSSL